MLFVQFVSRMALKSELKSYWGRFRRGRRNYTQFCFSRILWQTVGSDTWVKEELIKCNKWMCVCIQVRVCLYWPCQVIPELGSQTAVGRLHPIREVGLQMCDNPLPLPRPTPQTHTSDTLHYELWPWDLHVNVATGNRKQETLVCTAQLLDVCLSVCLSVCL